MRSKGVSVIWVGAGLFAAIMTVLAISTGARDLAISKRIVSSDSPFGVFIEDYGEIPSWMVIIFASALSIFQMLRIRPLQISVTNLVAVGALFLSLLALVTELHIIVVFIIILASVSTAILFNKRSDLADSTKIRYSQCTLGLLIIVPGVITRLIKWIWGRVRFRELQADFSDFTPWYQINGITGDQSFISGHTAVGAVFFPIIILISASSKPDFNITKGILIAAWPIAIAFGRVIIGAHYLSDVLVSLFLGYVVFKGIWRYLENNPQRSFILYTEP